MKVILSKWLPGLFILFFPAVLFSQNKTIDSLKAQLSTYNTVKNFEADTNYLNTLNELAFRYTNINPDTSIAVAARTEILCNKINYQNGSAEALKNLGLAHNMKGEYDQALDFLGRALAAAKASG